MSESWDAEVFHVPDLSWQTQAPPTRHPVPVRYVPGLQAGDEVTIGLPGRCFIDGQVLARTERGVTTLTGLTGSIRSTGETGRAGETGEQEAVAVAAPYAYWLAQAFPPAGLTMQWWPVALAWHYRDAVTPGRERLGGAPAADDDAGSWLDHVRPTMEEPPTRHPSAARMAGSLTGRTVRLQHERGRWSWWVAVSEPVQHDGDFVVHVMPPSEYWLAQAVFESAQQARVVPLHRLYVYD